MSVIEIKEVTKTFVTDHTRLLVLDNVSFSIGNDEFVCLVGPSGCGKSTLLRMLAGLEKSDSGKILFHGQPIEKPTPKIAMVFQLFGLLPWKTALENVELPLIYSDAENIRKHAINALENVNLKDRMTHYPNELSGGQQQRVAIARAIVNNPEIILADEPTGNLDSQSSYEVMSIFQKLNIEGNTIVLITHEPDIAKYAGRIIKISDGKILTDILNDKQIKMKVALPVN